MIAEPREKRISELEKENAELKETLKRRNQGLIMFEKEVEKKIKKNMKSA
jgi:hypothetical protein